MNIDLGFTLYNLAFVLGASITAWLAWVTWKRRRTTHTSAFSVLMLAVAAWLVFNVLSAIAPGPDWVLLCHKLGYIGVLLVPAAWFIFALQYGGYGDRVTPWRVALLMLIPLVLEILVWTGFFWTKIEFSRWGPYYPMTITWSNWRILLPIYSYGLILVGTILLLRAVVGLPRIYRLQAVALLVGMAIPLIANIYYQVSLSSSASLDYTPLSFVLSGAVIAWGLYRYQLLSLLPIAQDLLMRRMPVGFIVLDASLKIADLNPAAERIIRQTRSSALGQPLAQIFPVPLQSPLHPTSQDVEIVRVPPAPGQEPETYEIRSVPIGQPQRDLFGYLLVLQNITVQIRSEEALSAALTAEKELNETRARLIANASHEFRTPLSVILSSNELLENYGAEWQPGKRAEHHKRINNAVTYLTRVTEELSMIGKMDAGKISLRPVRVDLARFCQEILAEFRQMDAGKHVFRFEIAPPGLWLVLDELLLRQVLTNLLDNAVKYSPENSIILLQVCLRGQAAVLEIVDEGIGINESDLSRVGEPFYRGENAANLPGTGLGLAIVRKSLNLLGGDMQISSRAGQGTRITLSIPGAETASP